MSVRDQILDFLREQGGSVSDESGRATVKIADGTDSSKQYISTVLKEMEDDGVIEREVRGRRTFSIKIHDYEPPTERTGRARRASTAMEHVPAISPADLAAELLRLVVERAGQPQVDRKTIDLHRENIALNRAVMDRDEQIRKLRSDIDMLRGTLEGVTGELKATKSRLEVVQRSGVWKDEMLSQIKDRIDDQTLAELKRVMQEIPVG